MILRKLFGPTKFWEWGNGDNYITRDFALSYYHQALFLAALQPISSLGRFVLRFPDRTHVDTHTHSRQDFSERRISQLQRPLHIQDTQETDNLALSGFRTGDPSNRDWDPKVPSDMTATSWRKMRWVGHVSRTGEKSVLVKKVEGKRQLGIPRRRWHSNNEMDRIEISTSLN